MNKIRNTNQTLEYAALKQIKSGLKRAFNQLNLVILIINLQFGHYLKDCVAKVFASKV